MKTTLFPQTDQSADAATPKTANSEAAVAATVVPLYFRVRDPCYTPTPRKKPAINIPRGV